MIALVSQLAHLSVELDVAHQTSLVYILGWKYVHTLSAVLTDAGLHHSASCQQYR